MYDSSKFVLQETDTKITAFKERWAVVHDGLKKRVVKMTELVDCWNKLDGLMEETFAS